MLLMMLFPQFASFLCLIYKQYLDPMTSRKLLIPKLISKLEQTAIFKNEKVLKIVN
jgi:hypothetical protein